MKKFWTIFFFLIAFFTLSFLLLTSFDLPILTDPLSMMTGEGVFVSGLGFLLLVSDILLPIPSSLIMIAHGAIFGWVLGSFISLLGGLGASLLGYWIGKRGGKLLQRFSNEAERKQARLFMDQWGDLAIILSRPVPLLSESVAIMAGANGIAPTRFTLASVLGLVPAALVYAYTGVYSAEIDSGILSFLLVMGVAGISWFLGRYFSQKSSQGDPSD